jgi:acyl-CoA synthetase (AMP-forming)/AMP-acid ligase II
MIKTLGANVSPREVELELEMLPEVSLAIVLGIPDEERGQIVGAVLVPTPGHDVDLEVVRVHAMEQVSSYKVPRCTLLVPSEEMPSLGSGKPDKLVLLAMLEEAVAADSS